MSSRPSRGAARLAAILDALPDALLLVNANGTVVNANSIALETFEAPGTALVGRGLLDLLPAFDSKRIPGSMRRPDPEEGPRTKPTRMIARRTDGTEFPVEVTSANLEDARTPYADGHVPFTGDELLMLVVRDLTGTLDTETELARQQRQTEMILRAASEGVVGVDTDGKVVLVNPAAAQILGFRAGDLGGQELHPLIHHSRPDGTPLPYEETPLADTLRSGRKHRVRGQVLWTKDGRMVPVDLTTAPVREGEALVGAVMTFTDRTRVNALAARHAQLRAVLDASLRGPLKELRAELKELAEDPAGHLWPEANQTLHHLLAGYTRMTSLIDNVLDYQKLDSGSERLIREKIGLDEVVSAGVEGAVELIGPGRAQYAVHAPPIKAVVDGIRLAQAIAHLIVDVAGVDSAGRTAMTSGDSTIVVAAAQRGDVVRIDVRGPHGGGSAVHLPIVRGIVERHGGVLQTHKVSGGQGGSAYVLEVPIGDVGDVEDDEPAAKGGAGGENDSGMTVMPKPTNPVRGTTSGAPGARGATAPAGAGGSAAGAGRPPQPRRPMDDGSRGRGEPIALPPGPAGQSSMRNGMENSAQNGAQNGSQGGEPPTGRRRALRDGGANGPGAMPEQSGPEDTGHGGADGGPGADGMPPYAGVQGAAAGRRARRALADGQQQAPTGRQVHALPAGGQSAEPVRPALPQQASGEGPQGWPEPQGAHTGAHAVRPLSAPARELPPALPQAAHPHAVPAHNGAHNGAQNGARQAVAPQNAPGRQLPQGPQGAPAPQGPHALPAGPSGVPEPTGRRAKRPGTAPHPGAMPPESGGSHAPRPPHLGGPELPELQDLTDDDQGPGPFGQGMPFPMPEGLPQHHDAGPHGGPQTHGGPPSQGGGPNGSGRRRRLAAPGAPGAEGRPHPEGGDATGQTPYPVPGQAPGPQSAPGHPGGSHGRPHAPAHSGAHPAQSAPRAPGTPGAAGAPALPQRQAPQGRPQPHPGANPAFHPSDTQGHGQAFAIGAPAEGSEGPELLDGPDGAVQVMGDAGGEFGPRRLLVWPEPDVSTRQALTDRGYRPVTVRSREEVDAQVAEYPAALFVDPLTGPITRTALQSLRAAAVAAEVPVLVTAGLGQATREAAYGADPAVLLKALAPRDSDQHPPRVLLIESHHDIAVAFTATLERRGMQVAHAGSEEDAAALAARIRPNLVVMDLMLVRRRQLGIVDWLRANGLLNRTPLVVYTSVDIDAAELPRLSSGETVLFLAERSTSPEVQGRIVDMLSKIGTDG